MCGPEFPDDWRQEPQPPEPLGEQIERLRLPSGAIIGSEDDNVPDGVPTPSAHDPTTEINTAAIGYEDEGLVDSSAYADADSNPVEPAPQPASEPEGEPEIIATTETAGNAIEPADGAQPVEADTVIAVPAVPAVESTTETAEGEFGDTSLPRETAIEQFERWDRGEVVQSESTPVARVEVSEAEMAVLNKIKYPYHEVDADKVREGITDRTARRQTRLTAPQSRVVSAIDDRFLAAVQEDAAHNGYGELDMGHLSHSVRVGLFNLRDNAITPHVDLYRYPAVRYVLSIGDAGATIFMHGPVEKDQLTPIGNFTDPAVRAMTSEDHTVVTHGPGVVSRFMANHGIHATTQARGFRLFLTVDVDLRRRGG